MQHIIPSQETSMYLLLCWIFLCWLHVSQFTQSQNLKIVSLSLRLLAQSSGSGNLSFGMSFAPVLSFHPRCHRTDLAYINSYPDDGFSLLIDPPAFSPPSAYSQIPNFISFGFLCFQDFSKIVFRSSVP